MTLVIHAHALRKEARSQAFTGVFDERGGTIGRSDTNTLTLPDPERHVSRLQAEVLFANGAYSIRNVGSANAIELNGRALEPGEGAPLAVGDRLIIGGYALDVAAPLPASGSEAALARPMQPADSRTVIRASASEVRTGPPRLPGADPFGALWSGASSAVPTPDDPFADLLGPVATPMLPSPPTRPTADFDPFADLDSPPFVPSFAPSPAPSSAPAPRAPAPASARDATLDDFLGGLPSGPSAGSTAPSLDDMFGLSHSASGASADSLDEFLAPARHSGSPPARQAAQPPMADHAPALSSAYRPPAIAAAPRAAAPAPQPPPVSTPPARLPTPVDAATEQALWNAFCEGAGLSMALPHGLNPEMMRVMGQILRNAVEGTLKLVVARAGTKQELRAQVTVIQSKNNNPLKFSVDPESALTQLLQPPVRGFMTGPDAVSDAMDDLLGHHFGTMAGMRAALAGVLQRFEPAQLEHKLAGKGLIDTLLPMNRRARLWDLYVEHCQQVQDEAQDDFHELFGKAFVKAYEEQLDRLHAQRRQLRP